MSGISKEDILEALKKIEDPELRLGIVDLGLIYRVDVDKDNNVSIDMTLTAPGCPYGDLFIAEVKSEVDKIKDTGRVVVNLVFDPPWDPEEMASDYAKDELGIW